MNLLEIRPDAGISPTEDGDSARIIEGIAPEPEVPLGHDYGDPAP